MIIEGRDSVIGASPEPGQRGRFERDHLRRLANEVDALLQRLLLPANAGHLRFRLCVVDQAADIGALHPLMLGRQGVTLRQQARKLLRTNPREALPFGVVGVDILLDEPRVREVIRQAGQDGSLDGDEVEHPAIRAGATLSDGRTADSGLSGAVAIMDRVARAAASAT